MRQPDYNQPVPAFLNDRVWFGKEEKTVKLTMYPCAESADHGDNCWSVFRAGTDYCEYAHVTYAQAYYYCNGVWPPEDEE